MFFSFKQNFLSVSCKLKVPSQTSSPSRVFPQNSSMKSTESTAVVWFRNDLRIHDNECLTTANNESTSLLPVYCFNPADYAVSSSGFNKTGPTRAKFVLESVSNLRKNLQAHGSNLVVRVGSPENVLVDLVKSVGADAVYMHREVSHEEVKMEENIEKAMKSERVKVKYFWGSTLYHLDDLPFELKEMPTNYGKFKESVIELNTRKTIEALDMIKNFPKRGDVDFGGIPSLTDFGLDPVATSMDQNADAFLVGGETEGLQRLRNFAAKCKAEPNIGFKDGMIDDNMCGTTLLRKLDAPFMSKLSPWLATGCLSPRSVFDELKSASSIITTSSTTRNEGSETSGAGTDWLMNELLWRDFFRFIVRKYSSHKQHR